MTEVIWEEPPKKEYRGPAAARAMQAFIEQVKTRPGSWALYPHSVSAQTPRRLRELGLEAVLRKKHIYARWPAEQ